MASAGGGGATVTREGDRVAVGGRLDFESARGVLERVAPAIESAPSLTIDLGGVTSSNSAGLALVVEWLGIARRSGHELALVGVPGGLRQLARVCQVDALLAPAIVST